MRLPDDCIRLADSAPDRPAVVPHEDLGFRSAKFAAWGVGTAAVLREVKKCDINVRDVANAAAK